MSTFNFDRYNEIFNTDILIDRSVNFGMVSEGDIETIVFNPNSDWEGEAVSFTQFYFHELGHILHNRAAVARWEGWEIAEDFHGLKVQNLDIEKWFKENEIPEYKVYFKRKRLYIQYFKDHREWFAESHSILVHKRMGWPLRQYQELFYDLCIKGHKLHESLILTVEDTVNKLG